MPNVPILIKPKRVPGQRINVPSWLADPNGIAPCLCGRGMVPGESCFVTEGELGFKRWFHSSCWAAMVGDDEWDDEE